MYKLISDKITNNEAIIDIIIILLSFIFSFILGPFTWSFMSFLIWAIIYEIFLFLITGGQSPEWKWPVRVIANIAAFIGFCSSRYIFLNYIGVEHYF